MAGLGTMGRNLVLNMAEHGFAVAGYDRDAEKGKLLSEEAGAHDVRAAGSLQEMIDLLRRPRVLMLLVPAGAPVDAVIRDALPRLEAGDILIDGGNSHFRDTELRAKAVAARGVHLLGVGISGGEHGARHGPSMMPGGPTQAYDRVRPIFKAIAARADGEPCVAYLGPGSAGHYVKMVHNGIEYGLMQLIAETYDLLKRGVGLGNDELQATYEAWNGGELSSYLLEITADIFSQEDPRTGGRLIDLILDEAEQKGTGMWTSQDAMDVGVPVPTIDAAVTARNLSAMKQDRERASKILSGPAASDPGRREDILHTLPRALYAAEIITYTQGMSLLARASAELGYGLDLETVARIWRGGCIIRAAVLEEMRAAFRSQPKLPSLLLDPQLGEAVMERQQDLRSIVGTAAELGLPAPALMAALAYFDGYRSAWLPANLIQAQRDYFGAHTYERVDARGTFHTEWEES
jgi:6-phosphogluconate dehydrogenase